MLTMFRRAPRRRCHVVTVAIATAERPAGDDLTITVVVDGDDLQSAERRIKSYLSQLIGQRISGVDIEENAING